VSGEPRNPAEELAKGMEAAGALIESLEEEVANLRRDLEQASVALKAAQQEVSARERALEEKDAVRAEAERKIENLRGEIGALKTWHSNEQLKLRNERISELAGLRRKLEEQRRTDVEAASSEERVATLKEEFRREREALEQRHTAEMEALKTSWEQWEEKLREGYREQEERHRAELESMSLEVEARKEELEQTLREDFERRYSEERRADDERHEAALQALRNAAAGREFELQQDYQAVVESQQLEIESLREQMEQQAREAEELRKKALRDVKALAESRERELRRSQASKLSETGEAADRRVASLQAQREADNGALRARHAEEIARIRREYEERLAAEDERRKLETWALEERLEESKIQRDTEIRAYTARLTELEAARLAQKTSAEEDLERVVERFGEEISGLESRITELEEALEESERLKGELESEFADFRTRTESGEPLGTNGASREGREEDEPDGRLKELDAENLLAEERISDLEAQLREAREESRRNAEELEKALESLKRLSEPERRLRDGIALFNASEHARAVASISKALGLPRVHAGLGGGPPGKPVLTFSWGDMAWRRYISDPTEGVEEPRVYLTGTGDDSAEIEDPARQPNARMDAQGRLMLGIRAR
jgi:DNA repair exonuclease SbcCD ATPase subunit